MRKDFKVGFLSGAGLSAESGIATFRGMGGMWENHKIEEVATFEGFRKNPLLVWQFYEARRRQAKECKPNRGHIGMANLQNEMGIERCSITTQNVDGLLKRAGAKKVNELHGSLFSVKCMSCLKEKETYDDFDVLPPSCECGGMLRPAIVWFGEMLKQEVFEEAYRDAISSHLYVIVGTSGVVEPAASLGRVAKSYGAKVWEINPEESALSSICDKIFRNKAGEVMDEVVEEILKMWKG